MAQIDLKNATIKFQEGSSGTPNYIEVKIGEGNISWTEFKEREYTLDKGSLDEVRNADEKPVEVSIDFVWEYITGGSGTGATATPVDALKKTGPAASWVSSDSDTCRPYAIDIFLVNEPDCTGDKETITLSDFRYEQLAYDLRNGTISCTGKCNVTEATTVREAQST